MAEALAVRRDPVRMGVPVAVGATVLAAAVAVMIMRGDGQARQLLGIVDLALLALIAATDARTFIAPNRIVYPALAFALLGAVALGPAIGVEALAGCGVAFVGLLVVALAGRGAMGFGDVKAGALCGAVVGLHGVVPMLVITFLAGGVLAAVCLGFGVRQRKDTIAFTPLLVGGVLVSLAVFDLYLVT